MMGEAALQAELPSPRAAQGDLADRNLRPRVAVIGGGVAGCAAANYLQRNNVQCFLFEVLNHGMFAAGACGVCVCSFDRVSFPRCVLVCAAHLRLSQRNAAVGGKLAPVATKFFTFSGASAPMFCAKSLSFTKQVEQMVGVPTPILSSVTAVSQQQHSHRHQVLDGALMRWAPRLSVLTDDGVLRSVPEGGSSSSDYVTCSICNATMSKSAVSGIALMRLGCCFNIACSACFGPLWGIKPTAGIS